MTISGDHLRRRHRPQLEGVTDVGLDLRRDVGIRADRAAELHHRDRLARRPQAGPVTVDLRRPQRHLGAERGRLGVDAVRPADHHGVAMGAGQRHERTEQLGRRVDQQVGRVGHRPAERRVDDVGRRQAVVDPRTRRLADRRLDDIDECRHVVVGHRLAFEHRLDERLVDDGRAITARRRVVGRHHAERRVALGRQQFDLEPTAEAPDRRTTPRPSRASSSEGSRRPDEIVVALGPDADHADGDADLAFDDLDEPLRLRRQLAGLTRVVQHAAPSVDRLVDRFDIEPAVRTDRGSSRARDRRASSRYRS